MANMANWVVTATAREGAKERGPTPDIVGFDLARDGVSGNATFYDAERVAADDWRALLGDVDCEVDVHDEEDVGSAIARLDAARREIVFQVFVAAGGA